MLILQAIAAPIAHAEEANVPTTQTTKIDWTVKTLDSKDLNIKYPWNEEDKVETKPPPEETTAPPKDPDKELPGVIPEPSIEVPGGTDKPPEEVPEKNPEIPVEEPTIPEEWIIPKLPLSYEAYMKGLNEAFASYQSTKSILAAKNAIYYTMYIPRKLNTPYLTDKQEALDKWLVGIYKPLPKETQQTLALFYATEQINKMVTQKNDADLSYAKQALDLLNPSPEKTALTKKYEAYKKIAIGNNDFPGIPGTGDYIGGYKPLKPKPDNGTIPNFQWPSKDKPKPVVKIPFQKHDRSTVTYKMSGNSCVRTEVNFQNNKEVGRKTTPATGAEASMCKVNTPSGSFKDNPRGTITYNGYNPYDEKQRQALYQKVKKEKEDSILEGVTIQYTFEKGDESPYYYDTGIVIGEQKIVSYEQAKAALHLVSVQARGQFVEDTDQVLALVDGQVIRIHAYEGSLPFADFAKNFDATNVGVIAQDTRSGTQQALADLVEIKQVDRLHVNSKEVSLETALIVENNVILFPAEQIVSILDGTITQQDTKYTVTIGADVFTYEENRSVAQKGNDAIDLSVPTRYNEQNVFMIPIQSLLTATGKELMVEGEELHLQ